MSSARASREGFLWADASPGRSERVRGGEITIAPAGPRSPTHVPDGLIHDWVGCVFVPGVTIDDALGALRDYSRYKDWFQPAVADSTLITSAGGQDRFSMVLMNRSFFKDLAFETEYESRFVRVDEHSGYSVSRSTRIQEIEKYGSEEEHFLPEGDGSGLIWRLMSITRYKERDGGLYLELEAIGLSRDIPASLRWMIEPIVRRIVRAALATLLRQMTDAVLTNHAATVSSLTESRPHGASNKSGDRSTPQR